MASWNTIDFSKDKFEEIFKVRDNCEIPDRIFSFLFCCLFAFTFLTLLAILACMIICNKKRIIVKPRVNYIIH